MTFTWYIPFITALIPLLVGFVWYNPKVFGTAWMKATDMTEEKAKKANMVLMFGLTYLFSLIMCVILSSTSIHQLHLFSLFASTPDARLEGSESQTILKQILEKHGTDFRTFKHGAFHGTLLGFVCALPVIGINAIFEMKGFKYIAINAGYWIVAMALMGGVLCAFL